MEGPAENPRLEGGNDTRFLHGANQEDSPAAWEGAVPKRRITRRGVHPSRGRERRRLFKTRLITCYRRREIRQQRQYLTNGSFIN